MNTWPEPFPAVPAELGHFSEYPPRLLGHGPQVVTIRRALCRYHVEVRRHQWDSGKPLDHRTFRHADEAWQWFLTHPGVDAAKRLPWWIRFRESVGCHRPEGNASGYGPHKLARCRDCKRRIYSDGGGGWFLASVQPIGDDEVAPKAPHPDWLDR